MTAPCVGGKHLNKPFGYYTPPTEKVKGKREAGKDCGERMKAHNLHSLFP